VASTSRSLIVAKPLGGEHLLTNECCEG